MNFKMSIGLFLIGLGLGMAIKVPALPEQIVFIEDWLWVIAVVAGLILIIKNN